MKNEDFDALSKIDQAQLARFKLLDQETQQEIIRGLERIARNGSVPEQDRKIASAQARQYRKAGQ